MTATIGIVRRSRLLRQSGPIFSFQPSNFDPATVAWVAAVIAAGGTVSAGRESTVDTLIRGLKSDGVFSKLDRLWIHAAENQTSALVDMIADASATAVNSPTFTTNRGFNGQAQGAPTIYIDSGYKDNTGPNFAQNTCHVSSWVVTLHANDNGDMVATNNPNTLSGVLLNDAGTVVTGPMTNAVTNTPTFTYSSASGHWLSSRTASNLTTLYQNGASVATAAQASAAVNGTNFFITAQNNNGTAANGVASVLGMTSMGLGLSSTDVTNFYNRLRTYMTAVGVP